MNQIQNATSSRRALFPLFSHKLSPQAIFCYRQFNVYICITHISFLSDVAVTKKDAVLSTSQMSTYWSASKAEQSELRER